MLTVLQIKSILWYAFIQASNPTFSARPHAKPLPYVAILPGSEIGFCCCCCSVSGFIFALVMIYDSWQPGHFVCMHLISTLWFQSKCQFHHFGFNRSWNWKWNSKNWQQLEWIVWKWYLDLINAGCLQRWALLWPFELFHVWNTWHVQNVLKRFSSNWPLHLV